MPLERHERRGSEIRVDIWPGQMSSPKVACSSQARTSAKEESEEGRTPRAHPAPDVTPAPGVER